MCVFVSVYVYIHTYIFVCVCKYVYVCMCIFMYCMCNSFFDRWKNSDGNELPKSAVDGLIYVYMHVCMYVLHCIYVHMKTYTCVCSCIVCNSVLTDGVMQRNSM